MSDEAGPSRFGDRAYEGMRDIVEGKEDFGPNVEALQEISHRSPKRKTSSILRRRSQTSSSSDQDRLSIGSSIGDTLNITLSRRSSRVRFSDIETLSPEAGPSRRISTELPARIEFPLPRIRPSSLPLSPSPGPGYAQDTDFMPRKLPTPQHSPVKSKASRSLRTRSSVEGLRADLELHRLSQSLVSRRSSRSSITSASSQRTSQRYSVFSDPDDLELLADLDHQDFTPQQLRYPTPSRPSSIASPYDITSFAGGTPRPKSFPMAIPLPELPITPVSRPKSLPAPHLLPPLPELPTALSSPTESPAPLATFVTNPEAPVPLLAQVAAESGDTIDASEQATRKASPPTRQPRRVLERVESSYLSLDDIASFPIPPSRIGSSSTVSTLSSLKEASDAAADSALLSEGRLDTVETDTENVETPEMTGAEEMDDMLEEEVDCPTSPGLGSSPALSEMMERMRLARPDCFGSGDESELDLEISPVEAAIKSGVLSPHTRLLARQRALSSITVPSTPPRGSRRPLPRRASYNDALGESSDSDDEAWSRTLRSATTGKLPRSSLAARSISHSATLEPSSTEPNSKRMSNISQSSSSSTELLTPDPRRSGFNLDFKASMTASQPWARANTSTRHGLGYPIKPATLSNSRSIPLVKSRPLPRPTRQVKGWGPPEILIDEESDDELVVLSSSDDEACLAPKQGGFRMSSHFDFDQAKRRSRASTLTVSRRTSMATIDDEDDGWLMDEEVPEDVQSK